MVNLDSLLSGTAVIANPLEGQKAIGSKGPRTAKIVIVGEAPGKEEVEKGIPFVGQSGRELDRMLADAGINPADCYFTNVTLIRPKDNDISEWMHAGKKKTKGKKITPAHWKEYRGWQCEPHIIGDVQRLYEELKEIKPNVVLAVGRTPFWALCREGIDAKTGTISRWRGSTLESDAIPGLKVIPAFHPAFILRAWYNRKITVQDYRRVLWASASPDMPDPGWEFTIRPTYHQATNFLQGLLFRLEAGEVFMTCDVESVQGKTLCVGIGISAKQAICIPVLYEYRFYFPEDQRWFINYLMYLVLTHKNARVINQNIPYDTQFLMEDFIIYPNIWWDTMVGQNVLWPGTPANLAYQASMYCKDYRYWKDDTDKFWESKRISNWDEIWFYNCEDCARTFEVFERQREAIAGRKLQRQFDFLQRRIFRLIMKLMFRGVRVDHKRRLEMLSELLQVVVYARNRVNYFATRELNVQSPKQLADFFYKELKLPPQFSDTGAISCDADALVALAELDPLVREPVKWINLVRSYATAITVCKAEPEPNGRWKSAYSLGIVKTYRLSSKENAFGRGLNLMNITSGKDVKDGDDD